MGGENKLPLCVFSPENHFLRKNHTFFYFIDRWPVTLRAVRHICAHLSRLLTCKQVKIYFPLHLMCCCCVVLVRWRTLFKSGSLCCWPHHTHLCLPMFLLAGKYTLSGWEMRQRAPVFKQCSIFLPPDEGPLPSHAHTYVHCVCVCACAPVFEQITWLTKHGMNAHRRVESIHAHS